MKKIIIAIIFSILATLFFVGSVLIYNDNDTSGFIDDLTYSEGTVKQANQGVDNNGKIIAYSVVLEENIVLTGMPGSGKSTFLKLLFTKTVHFLEVYGFVAFYQIMITDIPMCQILVCKRLYLKVKQSKHNSKQVVFF